MTTHKGLVLGVVTTLVLLAQPAPGAQSDPPTQWFSPQRLERMVAPIALYPDALLAQILMAASYPAEVREAARWLRRHPHLEGEDLEYAAARQPWDASVKALLYFPDILQRLDDYPDWIEDLGTAFLNQEQDLMDAVQQLRQEAWIAGNLRSTPQQRVYREGDIIVIQPVDSRVVYVPSYDFRTVYTDEYVSSGSSIQFGTGVVIGGLLTAAILWDDDYDRPHHISHYRGRGRWRDPGYWHHHDYRGGGWRRPHRISHWHRDDHHHSNGHASRPHHQGHSGGRRPSRRPRPDHRPRTPAPQPSSPWASRHPERFPRPDRPRIGNLKQPIPQSHSAPQSQNALQEWAQRYRREAHVPARPHHQERGPRPVLPQTPAFPQPTIHPSPTPHGGTSLWHQGGGGKSSIKELLR